MGGKDMPLNITVKITVVEIAILQVWVSTLFWNVNSFFFGEGFFSSQRFHILEYIILGYYESTLYVSLSRNYLTS